MTIFCVMEYKYRDASNYKVFGRVLIEGRVNEEEQTKIRECLYDHEFFVPEEVGIEPLQHLLWEHFGGPNVDDHNWHEIDGFRIAEKDDMSLLVWGTKEKLLQQFSNIRDKIK